ncbi:MAG: M24 family metallopeptidase [bacterium]
MVKLAIDAIQEYLREQNVDGWLLFDFRGQNYIAANLFDLNKDTILTRRWFYFIPQNGEPTLLVHKIERDNFPAPPKKTQYYVSWQELIARLKDMLNDWKVIAMEYSPQGAIPCVSCVDGGTLEMIASLGVEVVTSANLVQFFQSRWTKEQVQSHRVAVETLEKIKNQAFELIGDRIKAGEEVTEFDVQAYILNCFERLHLVTDEPPIVAVNANASNPHYSPTTSKFSSIQKNDLILIDLFAKQNTPQAVYGDITWMGFVGDTPDKKHLEIFDIVTKARDTGLQFLQDASRQGQTVQGWQVDKQVREYIAAAGYADYFDHRTGHSLNTHLHGNGVNIDSLETQDQRDIIPGVGFTIEPGIYLTEFGVRSEINVYYSEEGPRVFGPIQKEIVTISV